MYFFFSEHLQCFCNLKCNKYRQEHHKKQRRIYLVWVKLLWSLYWEKPLEEHQKLRQPRQRKSLRDKETLRDTQPLLSSSSNSRQERSFQTELRRTEEKLVIFTMVAILIRNIFTSADFLFFLKPASNSVWLSGWFNKIVVLVFGIFCGLFKVYKIPHLTPLDYRGCQSTEVQHKPNYSTNGIFLNTECKWESA